MLQCRWCEHDEHQHDIGTGFDSTILFPCRVPGCDCEDYEEDTELAQEAP